MRFHKSIRVSSHELRPLPLYVSIAIFVVITALDYITTGSFISINPQPQFDGNSVLRTLFIALSALLLVLSVRSNAVSAFTGSHPSRAISIEVVQGVKLSVGMFAILWISLLLALGFVLLFSVDPEAFSELSNEDSLIESGSALLVFIAAANMIIVLLAQRHVHTRPAPFVTVGLGLLAILFLLIGLEEVSWFQRVFGFATPDALSGNRQGELNLHNFASNLSEIVYYFGSFISLIFYPFLIDQVSALSQNRTIAFFAPSTMVLFVGASVAAFNFNLWNNATIQLAFFATLFILIRYAHAAWAHSSQPASDMRYYLLAICAVFLATQIVFIIQGNTLLKGWEVTEYKELLIPFAFFIYSLEMLMKAKKTIGAKAVISASLISLVFIALRLLEKFHV